MSANCNEMGQVDRREGLSRAAFEAEYLRPRRPVVIADALGSWRARETWEPRFFADRYRGRLVRCRGESADRTMDSYIDALDSSSMERPLAYLRNLNIQTDFPELVPDISPPIPFARPDWLSSRLMPRNWLRPNHLNQLFISGRGARISLHYDDWMTHNMVSNVYGSKRFVLFAPDQSEFLARRGDAESGGDYILSAIDPWAPDLDRHPAFAQARRIEVVIGPGDTLFIPAGWWHSSLTETTCISVSSSFANGSNWGLLIEEIRRLRMHEPKAKTAILAAYLGAVGGALAALERIGVDI